MVGSITGSIQNAGYAEHVAATRLPLHLAEPATFIGDCAAVITAYHKCVVKVVAAGGTAAHLWRRTDASKLGRMVKTKAHRTRAEAEASGDLEDFMGNFIADSLCKERAKERLPDSRHIAALRGAQERCGEYVRYVARTLGAWAETQSKWLAEVKAAGVRPPPRQPNAGRPHS